MPRARQTERAHTLAGPRRITGVQREYNRTGTEQERTLTPPPRSQLLTTSLVASGGPSSADREETNLTPIVGREGTNLGQQECLSFKSLFSQVKYCHTRNNAAICHLLSAIGNWLFAARSEAASPGLLTDLPRFRLVPKGFPSPSGIGQDGGKRRPVTEL
jgi:hypothetical protein